MKHVMTCGNTLLVGSKALDSYIGSKEKCRGAVALLCGTFSF